MPDTQVQGVVPLKPEEAFEVYVNQIDSWWPRQGIFPYSFAPATTHPRHIRFEPQIGGRFYETFADGADLLIGRITGWDPPHRLTYTWRDPSWKGETEITISFAAIEQGTEVRHEQSGFAAAGVPELPPYYEIGNRQTLAGFIAQCRAISELREKGLSFG